MTARIPNSLLERFISELSDAATEIVLWARPKWNCVDVELAVGNQIDARVRNEYRFQRWVSGLETTFFHDNFLIRLSEAVYQLALEAGIQRPFPDVELGIWSMFRRFADKAAGSSMLAKSIA